MNLQFSSAVCGFCLDGAKDAGGQQENRGDELKDAVHHKSDETERKQDKPDERIEDKGRNRDRPADNKQDAEEQKLDHIYLLRRYAVRCGQVPGLRIPLPKELLTG
jgi:hypothetical protein